MGDRVDLDAIERHIEPFNGCPECQVRELVSEVRAGRAFRDDIRAALNPGRERGFDGPDGVSKDEVLDDVDAALTRFDRATGARV